jgi:ATP-binding cassette, subfamily B, bacterial HlyB/CyaB
MKGSTVRSADRPAAPSSALAALAAVASRLGIETTAEQLRRRFSVEAGEPGTDALIGMARELGLEAKALRASFDELPRLSRTFPAILRARDGGALLVEDARTDPMKGSVVIVRDPSAPESELVAVEEIQLVSFWEGELILVKRTYATADEQQPFGVAWLFAQVMREAKLFRDVGYGALVSTIFAIAPPFIFMIVIDRVLVNNSYPTLNILVGFIFLLIVTETILGHVRRALIQIVTTRIDGRLNLYIVDKILKLPLAYFESNPTGRTLNKLQNIWQIRNFLTGQLFGTLLEAIPLLGLVPVMLILQWQLALIAFALAGLIFLVVMLFLPPLARAHRRVVAADHAKTAHLVETLYGMRTIKSLCLEGRRRKEWDRRVAEAAAARHAMGLIANWPQTLTTPLQRLIYSGCFALGAYMVLAITSSTTTIGLQNAANTIGTVTSVQSQIITPGTLVAFAILSLRLAAPFIAIATFQLDLAEVRGAIFQVGTVLNTPPEVSQSDGLKLPVKGEIHFKDVSFRYLPDAGYALESVSFTVPAGTVLGIMGRSGSGKTTVTRLLQRLHSGFEGSIKVDGMDLREIDLVHLRSNIGVVPQENFLFAGTVRENIAMARPDANFADIVHAAQISGAEEFIERLPRGYDTMLEEGATNLSGGQRQRIAVARALLINPPVLILDEATSALDAESEAIVNSNLKRMAKGRTVISISHRLSMLVEADAILVLERGKVYDIGTHEELLRRCDIYKHMWYQQNRHLDPETSGELTQIARESA